MRQVWQPVVLIQPTCHKCTGAGPCRSACYLASCFPNTMLPEPLIGHPGHQSNPAYRYALRDSIPVDSPDTNLKPAILRSADHMPCASQYGLARKRAGYSDSLMRRSERYGTKATCVVLSIARRSKKRCDGCTCPSLAQGLNLLGQYSSRQPIPLSLPRVKGGVRGFVAGEVKHWANRKSPAQYHRRRR